MLNISWAHLPLLYSAPVTISLQPEPLIGCGQAWKVLGIIDPEILIFSKVYFSHLEAILLHITELASSFTGSHCFISQ